MSSRKKAGFEAGAPIIGVLSIELHFPEAQSLKAKRMVVKSIKDKLRRKFNVAIAETGYPRAVAASGALGGVGERHPLDPRIGARSGEPRARESLSVGAGRNDLRAHRMKTRRTQSRKGQRRKGRRGRSLFASLHLCVFAFGILPAWSNDSCLEIEVRGSGPSGSRSKSAWTPLRSSRASSRIPASPRHLHPRRVTNDLKSAKLYVSVLGDEAQKKLGR